MKPYLPNQSIRKFMDQYLQQRIPKNICFVNMIIKFGHFMVVKGTSNLSSLMLKHVMKIKVKYPTF
jgi:hypothetical protein